MSDILKFCQDRIVYQLTDAQNILLELLDSEPNIVVEKVRQVGATTSAILYAVYKALSTPNAKIGYVCTTMSMCRHISDKARQFISLEDISQSNFNKIKFNNGSSITASSYPKEHYDILIIDEFAFHRDQLSIISLLGPTTEAKIISTKKSLDKESDIFNSMLIRAKDGNCKYSAYCIGSDHIVGHTVDSLGELRNLLGDDNYTLEYTLL